jgi:hypothetical protein
MGVTVTKGENHMARIDLSPRERFSIFILLNPMSVPNRAEGRKLDRVWTAINLDEIVELARKGSTTETAFAEDPSVEYQLTSDERDSLIDYLDRQMTGGMARILVKVGNELIRSRDGETEKKLGTVP